jgi:hypothetical protein
MVIQQEQPSSKELQVLHKKRPRVRSRLREDKRKWQKADGIKASMCISPATLTGAVLEQPSPTTFSHIFLSNTTAVPSAQAQLSLQRMIQYSGVTSANSDFHFYVHY